MINLSLAHALANDVTDRMWLGKDVSYKYLRVFGCRAFAHVPKEERSKLDDKTRQCIFLGYGDAEFGYRLWDPEKQKVFRSKDVVFFEDQTLEDIKKEVSVQTSAGGFVHLDLVTPLVRHDDGGDMQEDGAEANVDLPAGHVEQEEVGEQPPPEPQLRRSSRESQPSRRYSPHEYVMLTDAGEPESYQEAQECEQKEQWLIAMQDEMDALQKNHTYDLVELPEGRKALKNKWVFRLKTQEQCSQPKYKARLVVKDFGQKQGIDFEEIFSPVVKMSSICVALGIAASLDLEIE